MTDELIGYADNLTISAGQMVGFHVSTDFPEFEVSIVRLLRGGTAGGGLRVEEVATIPSKRGRKQISYPGSYALVENHPALGGLWSFTVQMWIFPTRVIKPSAQGLLSRWSGARGFSLVIEPNGELGIWLGDESGVEKLSSGRRLEPRTWCFVCASVDARAHKVLLKQATVAKTALNKPARLNERAIRSNGPYDSQSPLLIAAIEPLQTSRAPPAATGLYNGKIDRPALVGRALSEEEIELLEQGASPSVVAGPDLIGAWDFSKEISSSRIADGGVNELSGRLVNMPMRAVTDHLWNGDAHDHRASPSHYNAIHFHDDDLEDAGWELDFEWRSPAKAKSGFYSARLRYGSAEDHIPFFVSPCAARPTARALVIAPTLTYLAYANERLTSRERYEQIFKDRSMRSEPLDNYLLSHPELGMSLYNLHSDGSGCCYSSYLRPITNMRPTYRQWLTDGPRHLSADLNLIDWLERKGFDYDVITDHDLHTNGSSLLNSYAVAITGTHPEYWTRAMLTALMNYTDGGGHLMYLGGNGFYWVTAMDRERPHVVEVRRGNCGTRTWSSEPGETYLSSTGELGGLWRHRGLSPNRISGVGMTAMGYDAPTPGYRRKPGSFDKRAEFIFEGVAADETIGSFGAILGGAAGDELDRLDYSLGSPPHTLLLATAAGHSALYMPAIEDFAALSPITAATVAANVRADMVYFETPNGGAVFSVGAITWCGSLAYNDYNNNVSRITENVLSRFIGQ